MNWEVIVNITAIILGALGTGIPMFVKWNKARKNKNKAVTEAEKQKAHNEMLDHANSLIILAEETYKSFDKVMKAQGDSAGRVKKKSVISDLQAFALTNGYEFDAEFWSNKIDEIVRFTKSVNSKNG
jgi:hypothetical protein